MPEKTGIELLGESQELAPEAKRLLLTAYADTDVAIAAINDIGLDYYLLKPWDPPEERLFPVIDDLLGDWRRAHPEVTTDVQVVGDRWSDRTHELKTFLARNHVPYRWYDVERDDEGGRLFGLAGGGCAPTCRWCWCPTASRCGRRRCSRPPARSGCTSRPSTRCTTCASSAAGRPASPPGCTPPPRG